MHVHNLVNMQFLLHKNFQIRVGDNAGLEIYVRINRVLTKMCH